MLKLDLLSLVLIGESRAKWEGPGKAAKQDTSSDDSDGTGALRAALKLVEHGVDAVNFWPSLGNWKGNVEQGSLAYTSAL